MKNNNPYSNGLCACDCGYVCANCEKAPLYDEGFEAAEAQAQEESLRDACAYVSVDHRLSLALVALNRLAETNVPSPQDVARQALASIWKRAESGLEHSYIEQIKKDARAAALVEAQETIDRVLRPGFERSSARSELERLRIAGLTVNTTPQNGRNNT